MSMEGKRAIGPINELPLFLGTVLFSLETVGIVSMIFDIDETYVFRGDSPSLAHSDPLNHLRFVKFCTHICAYKIK